MYKWIATLYILHNEIDNRYTLYCFSKSNSLIAKIKDRMIVAKESITQDPAFFFVFVLLVIPTWKQFNSTWKVWRLVCYTREGHGGEVHPMP